MNVLILALLIISSTVGILNLFVTLCLFGFVAKFVKAINSAITARQET